MNEKGKPMKLYQKYIVSKTDGSLVDPDAQYLVLRIDKPENGSERKAARVYAWEMHQKGEKRFWEQLIEWIDSYSPVLKKEHIKLNK